MLSEKRKDIENGYCSLGIEFGSTRIKGVLIDENFEVLASGTYDWENEFVDGIWTYSRENILNGLKGCYKSLSENVQKRFGVRLKKIKGIGISAMMHGYIALDKDGKFLVPFRTWRNTTTAQASEKLTKLFDFPIPQRWSIAHLYQAILNGESHVKEIKTLTTLAGYVHLLLTGKNVLGIGDASGMFPIDTATNTYNSSMQEQFDALCAGKYPWKIGELLPKVLVAGQSGGLLLPESVKFLDASGELEAGCLVCPPEGDAGTGMVATNAVRERTGNVSAGTSVFSMVVLEKPLKKAYSEIDIVTTPAGKDVAMVHCNNCTSDLNAWVNLFGEFAKRSGQEISKDKLYDLCFQAAEEGESDCGGLTAFNAISGEPVTGIEEGRPMFLRGSESHFDLNNFFRTHLYSACAALKIGTDILTENENVKIDRMMGHGGFFKAENVGQKIMAAALNVPVSVFETAGEGGAWGIAVLAAFAEDNKGKDLETYLEQEVFSSFKIKTVAPAKKDVDGFLKFMQNYKRDLPLAQTAGKAEKKESNYRELKERVYKANMQLTQRGLVILTWGNASEVDREKGVIAIKPSGVDYDKLRPEDIVVTDLEGNVVEGELRPSSDLKTHVELYKAFPEIGGVVHTHSTYATVCAQSGRGIPCYGTTHADYFYGDIPCTRPLTKEEIESDYERNTGKVIAEYFAKTKRDTSACPAVLVKNHAPFTWGKNAEKAVENAYVLEQVAHMAIETELYNREVKPADSYLADKHYFRKHGKNAYYGQKKEK